MHTHRNPIEAGAVATCSLVETFRTFYLGDETYPRELGRAHSEMWSIGLRRIMRAHDREPERFHDVQFDDLNADPLGVVRGIYQWAGLTMEPAVERKMTDWLETHSEGKPGFHRYKAQRYGLDAEKIREQYSEYMDRYYP